MSPNVMILLATYNGERYLQQQLESLFAQTHREWRLAVRDDGSTDGTLRLLQGAARRDQRIQVMEPDGRRLGSSANFGVLMAWALAETGSPYFMFCDQDDVWRPDKIETSLIAMQRMEDLVGACTPILVHTDFEFVDVNLVPLGSLDTIAARLSTPEECILNRLLSQNFMYGCTMMLNRALVEVASPVPDAAEQHDYWVALVAAGAGRIVRVPVRTVSYRQHAANVTTGLRSSRLTERLRRLASGWQEAVALNRARTRQAQALVHRLRDRLTPARQQLLNEYVIAMAEGGMKGAWFAYRHGLRRQGPLQTARYLLSLLGTGPVAAGQVR